jgi:hypothetical protein
LPNWNQKAEIETELCPFEWKSNQDCSGKITRKILIL